MEKARFQSIQILRGLAALLVVMDHAPEVMDQVPSATTGPLFPRLPLAASFGASGVDLFFVISGFVMAHGLGGRGRGAGPRETAVTDFLVRRATRVLPLFWLLSAVFIAWQMSVGTSFATAAILNTVTPLPILDGPRYHYPPLYVGWSLTFEFVFYGVVSLVMASDTRRPIGWLLAATGGIAIAGLLPHDIAAWLDFVLNPIFGEFAMGVVAWLVWRRGLCRRTTNMAFLAGMSLLLICLCIDEWGSASIAPDAILYSSASGVRRLLVWGLPWALVLIGLVCGDRGTGRLSVALHGIGDASYALYLVHPFVMTAAVACRFGGYVFDPHLLAMLLLGASVAAGLAVHRFIERPLLRACRHMTRSRGAAKALTVFA
jgi:peptidoglycan/LPS O-acetylase OafA/YrhL